MDPAIDADGCDVTYVKSVDFKGWHPASLIGTAVSQQAMQVSIATAT
jgi:hypothetical protein